jgi:RimJ/RimL family protein N-acetyltransferase
MPPRPDERAPTLEGRHVRLEPLALAHVAALCEVGLDPALWEWTISQVHSADDMRRYVQAALAERDAGASIPFAQVERATGRVVGSTRLGNLAREHGRVEIGWTWLGRAWQRTALNTEAKLLLLAHAFETMGLRRVELKTDALNTRSRSAIRRLGAVEEGVLRQHMVTERGRVRDTVYYGILRDEWPAVRRALEQRLAATPDAAS